MQAHNALESFRNLNISDCTTKGLTLNLWSGEYYLYRLSNIESLKTRIGDFNGIIDLVNEVIFIAHVMLGRITQNEEKMADYHNSACYHPTAKLDLLFPAEEPSVSFDDEEVRAPSPIHDTQIDEMHRMMKEMTEALKKSEATLGAEQVALIFTQLLQMTAANSQRLDKLVADQQKNQTTLCLPTPGRQFVAQTPGSGRGSAFSSASTSKPPRRQQNVFG